MPSPKGTWSLTQNATGMITELLAPFENWFRSRDWTPFDFQREAWARYLAGESGLIHVSTGAGKTLASIVGALAELHAEDMSPRMTLPIQKPSLKVIYLSPLRSLARDIEKAIKDPIDDLGLKITVAVRSGDTSSYQRGRQREKPPDILISTPESLSLMLSDEKAQQDFQDLRLVIVDEWHELLSTKRGTQVELALSRLRSFRPTLRTWALSATLANLEEAALALGILQRKPFILHADLPRPLEIQTLLPSAKGLPWAGHLGLAMLEPLIESLNPFVSTLIFTNTRSFAERWYRALLETRPEWAAKMGIHHGSIDRKERARVEEGLKSGQITLVVTTSSLDLGVDFPPVERVVQIGSPKSVARLLQRSGRSSHRPGAKAHLTFVPTQALDLAEISAVKLALSEGSIESRVPLEAPLDVLAQHMVTCALGGGFEAEALFAEVKTAYSYQGLDRKEFDWVLNFLMTGGQALGAYPQHHKITFQDGKYRVLRKEVAKLHRLNVGTISSDASVELQFLSGKKIGFVEESFAARLKTGDTFSFGGRNLRFLRMKDLTAHVRLSPSKGGLVPRWMGGRLPFSGTLGNFMRAEIEKASQKNWDSPEMKALEELFDLQRKRSALPRQNEVLMEQWKSREGYHLYLYPFEGRLVHEGLALLLSYRFTRERGATMGLSVNDYGLELVSSEPFYENSVDFSKYISNENLLTDLVQSVNMSELARRQFRDIARVSGLTFQNFGYRSHTARQVQASSGLLYDVFRRYDLNNLFLMQAETEVLSRHLETKRLEKALKRLSQSQLVTAQLGRPSPFSFPLLVERMSAQLSTETFVKRLERMKKQWQMD